MGEALSTLTTTCAWFWENSRPRLISFKSMFLFLLFLGKAGPSFCGHFIRGHVQDDAERNSPACPLRKQGYLDHLLGAVTWLSYASTMLGHSLLPWSKKREKSNNPSPPPKQTNNNNNIIRKFASACGTGDAGTQTRWPHPSHEPDSHYPHHSAAWKLAALRATNLHFVLDSEISAKLQAASHRCQPA